MIDIAISQAANTQSLPGITLRGGFRFRQGQAVFLQRLAEALYNGDTSHLGVFVPGYGKTITAVSSFIIAHALGLVDRVVIFVPRGNLRDQYADPKELTSLFRKLGAPGFSFCVADSERAFLKNLRTQIIITTYQYASGKGGHKALAEYCAAGRSMFIFDEVHHLSDDGLWAKKIQEFPSSCSVALSGTPMRSDNKTLFGVPFEVREDGQQYYVALHEVTMRDAHEEGRILKRVKAHIVDYRLTMVNNDTGQHVEMSLSELTDIAKTKQDVDAFLARRKLRFHEVYLQTLLAPAFELFTQKQERLRRLRAESGNAGGRGHQMLIIAMSNAHAAAILSYVRQHYPSVRSERIGQDVPAAEREALLADYRAGGVDCMVQVDMIGEGTDIKPISVIVKADLVRALSKTLQQIFRGMRWYDGFPDEANVCDIFAANDSDVVAILEMVTKEEQLGVKLREKRQREQADRAPSQESTWELTSVMQSELETHSLELFPEYAPKWSTAELESHDTQAVNVSEREQELRRDCALLANKLVFVLRSDGRHADVRGIHEEAKKRISKYQEELSLDELEQKKEWLVRCIAARRLV